MDACTTSQLNVVLIRKLLCAWFIFDILSISVFTTRHLQTSGQLVQELNVGTVPVTWVKAMISQGTLVSFTLYNRLVTIQPSYSRKSGDNRSSKFHQDETVHVYFNSAISSQFQSCHVTVNCDVILRSGSRRPQSLVGAGAFSAGALRAPPQRWESQG